MSVDRVSSSPDIVTKGPGITGPHNKSWDNAHNRPHAGEGGRGFPDGNGGAGKGHGVDRPGGGNPGHGHGVDRPGNGNGGNGHGVDRPGNGNGNMGNGHGVDRPGNGNGNMGNGHGVDRPGGHHGHNGIGGGHGADRGGPGLNLPGDLIGAPRQMPGLSGPNVHGPVWNGGPHGHPAHTSSPTAMPAHQQAMPATTMQTPGGQIHAGAQAGAVAMQATLAQAHAPQQAATLHHGQGQGAPGRADAGPQAAPAAARPEGVQQAAIQQTGQGVRGEGSQLAPTRPDAAMAPRADAAMADRMAALARTPATAVTLPSAAATTAAGNSMAASSATQVADVRNVNNPLVANDRGQAQVRPEFSATYTGEGPQRRYLGRSARTLSSGLSTLLVAFGLQGGTGASGRDPAAAERELREATMQWLFWLLAIIAYACVAFAIVGLLPPGTLGGGTGGTAVGSRAWSSGFAVAGLVAGVGAWWFARGISRNGGGKEGDRR